MKITVIRHSIRNRGSDRAILYYLNHFAKQGHEVIHWTNEVNTDFYINPDIQIKKIPYKGILGTLFFTEITKFDTDAIIVDLAIMASHAHTRNKGKIIYTSQDYDIKYYRFPLLIWLTHVYYWLDLNLFKIPTVAVSDGLADILQIYKPKNMTVVPNPVDLEYFKFTENNQFKRKREKPFVILFFGRDDFRKGFDVAINTINELKKIRPQNDWEIWTIGKEALKIEGVTVKNLGFLSTDEGLRDVLSEADIYMCPSRSEGLSLLLLQALACKCAVVSTTVSYIIENEKNGLLSPVEDHAALAANLNRVLTDESLRERLKSEARPLAAQYGLENSFAKLEDFINKNVR